MSRRGSTGDWRAAAGPSAPTTPPAAMATGMAHGPADSDENVWRLSWHRRCGGGGCCEDAAGMQRMAEPAQETAALRAEVARLRQQQQPSRLPESLQPQRTFPRPRQQAQVPLQGASGGLPARRSAASPAFTAQAGNDAARPRGAGCCLHEVVATVAREDRGGRGGRALVRSAPRRGIDLRGQWRVLLDFAARDAAGCGGCTAEGENGRRHLGVAPFLSLFLSASCALALPPPVSVFAVVLFSLLRHHCCRWSRSLCALENGRARTPAHSHACAL
ncbi:hypothetical protein JIQ42_02098 [Leishmania sp. Namibia]|uniref:hypothetical protein n=1 Tax=Leishmania sp. Namibia TaxID=2802991 RepID=UPI001B3D498B|nr:hypothetical protein JIQ42_02098 [Leishmania sp. Namibia]